MQRSAIEMDDDRTEVRYHLATALVAAGGTREAKGALQVILTTKIEFASRNETADLLLTL